MLTLTEILGIKWNDKTDVKYIVGDLVELGFIGLTKQMAKESSCDNLLHIYTIQYNENIRFMSLEKISQSRSNPGWTRFEEMSW